MADMDNYEPDWYTDKVREEAQKLLKEITPIFVQRVGNAIEALQNGDESVEIDENDFIGKIFKELSLFAIKTTVSQISAFLQAVDRNQSPQRFL